MAAAPVREAVPFPFTTSVWAQDKLVGKPFVSKLQLGGQLRLEGDEAVVLITNNEEVQQRRKSSFCI